MHYYTLSSLFLKKLGQVWCTLKPIYEGCVPVNALLAWKFSNRSVSGNKNIYFPSMQEVPSKIILELQFSDADMNAALPLFL